jgi:SAM-dependent methyltransferase
LKRNRSPSKTSSEFPETHVRGGKRTTFDRSQDFYDAIYSFKNYPKEARELRAIIEAHKRTNGKTLLDVACGTGAHLAELRRWYRVEGADIDPRMLKVARARLKRTPLHRADMRAFDLGKRFDAVVCLFGSIGYVRNVRGLNAAVAAMARHTKPGGVLVIEPWVLREDFGKGRTGTLTSESSGRKIVRVSRSLRRGRISILQFHYLIATPRGVSHLKEHHELGLFSLDEYLRAFARAGLRARFRGRGLSGRGILVATKAGP